MTTPARWALRPWSSSPADIDFLFDMYSRVEVRRYIGDGTIMRERGEAVAMVRRWAQTADGVRGVRALTTATGGRLGSILLKRIPWSRDAAEAGTEEHTEIGWHLHPHAWGLGYASEAASAVLGEAWTAGIDRVVAVTNPANTASQRVCLRIGMVPLGRTRRYYDAECELFEIRAPEAVDRSPRVQPV